MSAVVKQIFTFLIGVCQHLSVRLSWMLHGAVRLGELISRSQYLSNALSLTCLARLYALDLPSYHPFRQDAAGSAQCDGTSNKGGQDGTALEDTTFQRAGALTSSFSLDVSSTRSWVGP